jgi:hypothetical protein
MKGDAVQPLHLLLTSRAYVAFIHARYSVRKPMNADDNASVFRADDALSC